MPVIVTVKTYMRNAKNYNKKGFENKNRNESYSKLLYNFPEAL